MGLTFRYIVGSYDHNFAVATLYPFTTVKLWAAVLTSSSTLEGYQTQMATNITGKLTSL